MKLIARLIGIVAAAGFAVYFVYCLVIAVRNVDLINVLSPRMAFSLLAATILYALIVPSSAFAWQLLLGKESGWRWSLLIGIMGATQIAKYIPGNIAQHASRAVLSFKRGMQPGQYLITIATETYLAVAAAFAIGTMFLLVSSEVDTRIMRLMGWVGVLLVCALASMPIWNKVGVRFGRLLHARLAIPSERWHHPLPSALSQAQSLAIYAANYLVIGVGFLIVARSAGIGPDIGYMEVAAAFSLSWLAGFLAPGMPAGLGVREGVMVLILGSSPQMMTTILVMRVATMVGDALWFYLGAKLLSVTGTLKI